MIDFHSHLDLYPDPVRVAQQANVRNFFTFCVTTSPSAWQTTSYVFRDLHRVGVGLGLHPEILHKKQSEVQDLLNGVSQAKLIGEIGMDGSPQYKSTWQLQRKVFSTTLQECSRIGGRILSVHSRRAVSAVLDDVERFARNCVVVLHWFSGTKMQVEKAVSLGCYFSVNPLMLSTSVGRSIFSLLPKTRILFESDGPFASINRHPIMPWSIPQLMKQGYINECYVDDCLSQSVATTEELLKMISWVNVRYSSDNL